MRVLKFFALILFALFFVLAILTGLLLSNEKVFDKTLRVVIEQIGIPLKYESLRGDILGGIAFKGLNYEDKLKADIAVKVDYPALADGVLHIQRLHAKNIWIEDSFLASLVDSNTTDENKEETKSADALKKVLVDDLEISLLDTKYHEYKINRLALHVTDFAYDMDRSIDGQVDLSVDSNVAILKSNIVLKKSHYRGNIFLDPDRLYLESFLKEQNITIQKAPHITAELDGDLSRSAFDLSLEGMRLHYATLAIAPESLHIQGDYTFETSFLNADATLKGKSDAADYDLWADAAMDLNDLNSTLKYRLKGDLLGAKPELAAFLHDENLTFVTPSALHIKAQGSLKEVDTEVDLKKGEIAYGEYIVKPHDLHVKALYDIQNAKIDASGRGDIFSNAADLNFTFESKAGLENLSENLLLNLKSDLLPKKPFLSKMLTDQNISLTKVPALHIKAVTKGEEIDADIVLEPLGVTAHELEIETRKLQSHLLFNRVTKALKSTLQGDILSNAGNLLLDANASLNAADINKTLRYHLKSSLKAKEDYLKKHLDTKRVDFSKLSPLLVTLSGDAKALDADLSLSGTARVDRYRFKSRIQNTKVHYDFHEHQAESDIDLLVASTYGDLKVKGAVSLDTDDLNNTLRYDTVLNLRQKEPLGDINLTQLGNIGLVMKGSLKKVDAKLHSKKLKMLVQSDDFDRFNLSLMTQKLYLDKLYLALPPEFKKSYAILNAKGYYMLKERKADLSLQVKKVRFAGRNISTNRFRFQMDGDDFELTPLELRAKGFLLSLDAKSKNGKIKAHLKNKALNADIVFAQKPLFADAKVSIPSVKKLLQEIDKLYPIAPLPKIDGALYAKAKMAGKERVKIEINAPKLLFPEGRIEALTLLAYYQPQRIDIPTFDFQLKGFKPKKMNRAVHLAHPAYIVLEEGKREIDFVLKDFLSLKAKENGGVLSGNFKTKKLYLGMEGYGETRLTTDIAFFKSGPQLAISGDVLLADTVVTYESRVLDVSQDPDIIIIKKKKKKAAADNSFIKNTFLDLHIRSKDEIEYKVEAGTIVVKPDIEIRKDFGEKLKLLGKVNILEGEYDFGDKRFQIKEGAIAFRGLEEINPHLDIHVEYPIDEVVIYIDILGDKRKPKLQFKSKPMMSKKDIFSYLLFGFAVSESDGAQSSAANAAEKIFGRALAKDLARELKLDRLDLTRNQLGGIDIKAGKKVNKKTIIYYQNKSLESSVIVERKLGKHFELDVEAGQESQAVDLFYKKGFK